METNENRNADEGDEVRSGLTRNPKRIPEQAASGVTEIDIFQLWLVIWRGRWLTVGLTAIFVALALAYAMTATEWYRAETLLGAAKENSGANLAGRLGGLGSLAGLAGIRVGESDDVESLAILGSRDFVRAFIEERQLLPVLYAEQWNPERRAWRESALEDQPDLNDAVKYFLENVQSIDRDAQTGLVTLAIEWTEPDEAADWAADLVRRLNEHTRRRALEHAEKNLAYLQQQMERTAVASVRDAIASLIEAELQKIMLAYGANEYSYKVIDSARPPKEPVRPKKILIILFAVILGGLISLFVVLLRHGIRQRLADDAGR